MSICVYLSIHTSALLSKWETKPPEEIVRTAQEGHIIALEAEREPAGIHDTLWVWAPSGIVWGWLKH